MVKYLPYLDWDLGFPLLQRVAIETDGVLKAYDFRWGWNESVDAFLTCTITRVEDSAIMWIGAIQKLNPIEVKDPTTDAVQFTMMARELDKDLSLLEVWIFEES